MTEDVRKFERRAGIAGALAHPLRLRIIDHLHEHGPTCVCQLVERFGCKQPIVSKHLLVLRQFGLVNLRKEGLKVFSSLKTPCTCGTATALGPGARDRVRFRIARHGSGGSRGTRIDGPRHERCPHRVRVRGEGRRRGRFSPIGSGMGKGPALALLLAGPALSLPSMLVINQAMGPKKTAAFVVLVVLLSTITGMTFGAIWG